MALCEARWILPERLVENGLARCAELVCVPAVHRRRSGAFSWLPKHSDWGLVCHQGDTAFYKVRHFSSAISLGQLRDIGDLVRAASPGVA